MNTQGRIAALLVSATLTAFGAPAFAAQAIEDDADLLFGAILLARNPTDVASKSFRRRLGASWLWLHRPLLECHDEPETELVSFV